MSKPRRPTRNWLGKLKGAPIVFALASVLSWQTQDFLETPFIRYTSIAPAVLLSALPALAIATAVYLLIAWAWRNHPDFILIRYSRVFAKILGEKLPNMMAVSRKPSFPLVVVLMASVIVACVGISQTHFWSLGRLWWSGPAVDLAATAPEKTFQSTINLPWFNYGQDFGAVNGWRWQGVSQNRGTLETAFAQLHQTGVKCVVWFLLSDGRGAPSFDAGGNVKGLDQTFWQDYDTAIEVARKYQIGIVWVLLDFHWLAPVQQENGATLFGHADIIKDSSKRESFFQQALIPILRRHPLEPQIAGWILVNEPENALKDANIRFEPLAEFAQRASALIKKYTYRQPVSIGSADLESLIEYWGKDSEALDFLVFHHYEKFLPPPVDYIRSLMAGANDKPIYIGEFKIQDPSVPIDELVNWSVVLGYASLWGWKLNEDKTAPHYNEARQISDLMVASRSDGSSLSEQFRQRRHPANSPFGQRIGWWERHGSLTVLPGVSANIEQWGRKLSEFERQMEKLKTERLSKEGELKGSVANCFRLNQADLQSHSKAVEELKAQIADYDNQLRQARENGDKAWENRVMRWLQDAQTNLRTESNGVDKSKDVLKGCEKWEREVRARLQDIDAEMRALFKRPDYVLPDQIEVTDAADALTSWYRYKILWSQKLYQHFWKAELQKQ